MPVVSVLIPTRNRLSLLQRALRSVYAQDYPDSEILVLDDASEDGTADYIRAHHPDIRLFRNEESRGQIIGRNILTREAKGDYLINLDDDAYFLNADAISNAVARMEAEPELAIINFRMLDPEGLVPFFPEAEYYTSCYWALGYCVRKAVLEEAGYYREIRTRLIGEESDLALRVLGRGYRILQFPRATVVHPHFVPGKALPGSREYRDVGQVWLFSAKTRLLHAWLNEPFPWYLLSTANALVRYTAKAAREGYLRHVLRGFYDALRDFPQLKATRRPVSSQTMRIYLTLGRHRVSEASQIRALYESPPGVLAILFGLVHNNR
jgi:hypothetical protein